MAQRLHIFQSKTPEPHTSLLKEGLCGHTSPVTAEAPLRRFQVPASFSVLEDGFTRAAAGCPDLDLGSNSPNPVSPGLFEWDCPIQWETSKGHIQRECVPCLNGIISQGFIRMKKRSPAMFNPWQRWVFKYLSA